MTRRLSAWAVAVCIAVALAGTLPRAAAQVFGNSAFVNRSVGGVAIDAEGVLEAPTLDDQRELDALRTKVDPQVPGDLAKFVDLRAVSLRQIESALAESVKNGKPVADEVRYLAGLQRVRYVFVYPERQDIVIAGPAEGWKVDALGNVVGQTTNRPVLLLEDLIVSLRSGGPSRMEAITCSIDPTPEGLKRLQATVSRMKSMGDPEETMASIEQSLGPQQITVTGVPATTHFARAMVAADFRMKRLAMNFEPAPVGDLPGFLDMMKAGARGMANMMPRWWLAPNYEPLAKSKDGLAWELRGPGVKCLTEEDYVSESGEVAHTGDANPVAQKWAEAMTRQYDELANHDSSFGQLRNIMDLAVIGALIEKEQLAAMAGFSAPQLMGEAAVPEYPAPRQTSSKASAVKQGRNWIVSASGGVEMAPWAVADRTETVESLSAPRERFADAGQKLWQE